MNARQKAKYWKKKYEQLAHIPMPQATVVQYRVDTLKTERLYPEALVVKETQAYIAEAVKKDLAFDIAEHLDKYIDYHTEFLPHRNFYKFSAEIKVVHK